MGYHVLRYHVIKKKKKKKIEPRIITRFFTWVKSGWVLPLVSKALQENEKLRGVGSVENKF